MEWFNLWGFIIMMIIMIPNIVYSIKCKDRFNNLYHNKLIETLEQIGRFGSFVFMCINIPKIVLGWSSDEVFAIYLIINTILIIIYCVIWIICFKSNSIFKALSLSIIPSIIFLFRGILIRSLLLIVFTVIFASNHIILSYKNTKFYLKGEKSNE